MDQSTRHHSLERLLPDAIEDARSEHNSKGRRPSSDGPVAKRAKLLFGVESYSSTSSSRSPTPIGPHDALAIQLDAVSMAQRRNAAITTVLTGPDDCSAAPLVRDLVCDVTSLRIDGRSDSSKDESSMPLDEKALHAVARERWQALFSLMREIDVLELSHLSRGMHLFEQLVHGGLPLENLISLKFNKVPCDGVGFKNFILQTPRLKKLRTLHLPDASEQSPSYFSNLLGGMMGMHPSRKTSSSPRHSASQTAGGWDANFHHLSALTQLRMLHASSDAQAQATLDLTGLNKLWYLKLRGPFRSVVGQGSWYGSALTSLNLSHCGLTIRIGEQLQNSPQARQIKILDVSHNPMLRKIDLSNFTSLHHLDVSYCLGGPNDIILPRASQKTLDDGMENLPLVHLDASGMDMRRAPMRLDLTALRRLQSLHLNDCNIFGDALREVLLPGENDISVLQLNNNRLGRDGLQILSQMPLRNLATLSLLNVAIEEDGAALELVRRGGPGSRWPDLRQLALGHVPDEGVRRLIVAVTEPSTGPSVCLFD